jgi:hypothetical protein
VEEGIALLMNHNHECYIFLSVIHDGCTIVMFANDDRML